MSAKPVWFVSRQIYWPDGEHVVEIASGGRDYSNPDMLVPKFDGEGEEYSDPIEALNVAFKIQDQWLREESEEIGIAHGCTGGMTMPFTPQDVNSLKEWAKEEYEKLEKCENCGEILEEKYYYNFERDEKFCGEYCAEKYLAVEMEEEQ